MVRGPRTGGQPPLKSSRAELLLRRAEDRRAVDMRRKGMAEELKEEGNKQFKQGRYVEAIVKYNEAIKIYGTRPIFMSNLAAAYLKLEQFELAEWACDCALLHSPRFAKARFRRAMARKGLGMFKGAELDLLAVIEHHPEITEAQSELPKVREDRKKHGDGQRPEPIYNEALPPLNGEEWDPPLDSDSEDARHTGNERPCRFYNHGGCGKGSACAFSHAPDDKSLRDNLGQNVCSHFLLGNCKFGTRCSYSHTKDYLPPSWWSTQKQVEEANRFRAALDDPETESSPTIETLENTTMYGRMKKFQDLQEDFKIYSALRSDVLTSRIKDKTSNVPTKAPAKDLRRFVLIICFRDLDHFEGINSHLLRALKSEVKVVYAVNATQAATYLGAPELAGAIIGDAGIADRSKLSTVSQLVDYAQGGGLVVFAGLFPSFISGADFNRFFAQHFKLQWKYGSYFRTIFYRNVANDLVKKNPSLEPSYSMKALHVQGVAPESVIYGANESSRTQSFVFPSAPVTNFDESPAVTARFGKGLVSFLGDVNAEDESTKTVLAMLSLLDFPLPSEPAHRKVEKAEAEGGQTRKTESENNVKGAQRAPSSPSTFGLFSTTLDGTERATLLKSRRIIMQLSLSDDGSSGHHIKSQIQALMTKAEVQKATSRDQALVLLSSPYLSGVYVTDCTLTKPLYRPILRVLASYVKKGGRVIFGGTFSSSAKSSTLAPLFAEFGLDWEAGVCESGVFELEGSSDLVDSASSNVFLPKNIRISGVFLKNVEPYNVVYRLAEASNDSETPVAFGSAGLGYVGYIGDVDGEPCGTPILLSMLDLFKHSFSPKQPKSLKFVVALVRYGFIDEYKQTPLFKLLEEKQVEIVTDSELSDARLVDLLPSSNLLGVLFLDDISLSERKWLGHQIAAYVWSGGTIIFCGDSGMSPPHELEKFWSDKFCLPWEVSSATVLPVKLNRRNELVRRLPEAIKQESVDYEGSFLYEVDEDAAIYSSKPGLGPERATHVPVAYTATGNGHVGFFGHDEIGEQDSKLVLAMLGLVPLATHI